jgi:DNA polymerase
VVKYSKWVSEWSACQKCKIGRDYGPQRALGKGSLQAAILFIGEAPGQSEAGLEEPFIGPAGALLSQTLELANIKRHEVYITNCIACRPLKKKGNGTTTNRDPSKKEIKNCMPRLYQLLDILTNVQTVCFVGCTSEVVYDELIEKYNPQIKRRRVLHPAHLLRLGIRAGKKLNSSQKRDYQKYVASFMDL